MKWVALASASVLALAAPHAALASPVVVNSTAAFAVLQTTAVNGGGTPVPYIYDGVTLVLTPVPTTSSSVITTTATGALATMPALLPVLVNGASPGSPASITVSMGQAFNFTIPNWGVFTGSINGVDFTGSPASVSRILDFVTATGTFRPVCHGLSALDCGAINPVLAGFVESPATATFSATQTGASRPFAAISSSFTFAWQALNENGGGDPGVIPAPAGLALFGLALVGLGIVRRARHGAAG